MRHLSILGTRRGRVRPGVVAAIVACAALAGCGQSGPLYLPTHPAQPTGSAAPTQPASAAASAPSPALR